MLEFGKEKSMAKKKQVESGSVKDRAKRAAAAASVSAQKVLHSPVLNVLADLHHVDSSENEPSSKQERDAFVEERRKALCSTHLDVPPGICYGPEYNPKTAVKESLEYQSKSQAARQLCNAIDEEGALSLSVCLCLCLCFPPFHSPSLSLFRELQFCSYVVARNSNCVKSLPLFCYLSVFLPFSRSSRTHGLDILHVVLSFLVPVRLTGVLLLLCHVVRRSQVEVGSH